MAVTNEKSNVFTNLSAFPPVMNVRPGMPQFWRFVHTQGAAAGDQNSTIEVIRIPAGAYLDLHLSTIRFSAYGPARVLTFGWRAYTDPDGTANVADLDGLFAALDVSVAGFRHMIEAPTLGVGIDTTGGRLFKGSADLVLQQTAAATIPVGAVTSGRIAYWPAGT